MNASKENLSRFQQSSPFDSQNVTHILNRDKPIGVSEVNTSVIKYEQENSRDRTNKLKLSQTVTPNQMK